MLDPLGIREQPVADAVALPDALGHGAETVFHQVEVKDQFVAVVLLGLGHPD